MLRPPSARAHRSCKRRSKIISNKLVRPPAPPQLAPRATAAVDDVPASAPRAMAAEFAASLGSACPAQDPDAKARERSATLNKQRAEQKQLEADEALARALQGMERDMVSSQARGRIGWENWTAPCPTPAEALHVPRSSSRRSYARSTSRPRPRPRASSQRRNRERSKTRMSATRWPSPGAGCAPAMPSPSPHSYPATPVVEETGYGRPTPRWAEYSDA